MSNSVTTRTVAARLLCPWDFPSKNTGVGCHFLLQGIFLTQRSNPHLLFDRQILYTEPWEAWKTFTTRLKLSQVHISIAIMTPGPLLFSVWYPGQQHWYHPGASSPSCWLRLHFNTTPSSFVCSLISWSTHLKQSFSNFSFSITCKACWNRLCHVSDS